MQCFEKNQFTYTYLSIEKLKADEQQATPSKTDDTMNSSTTAPQSMDRLLDKVILICCAYLLEMNLVIGPILDDRLKEKLLKP